MSNLEIFFATLHALAAFLYCQAAIKMTRDERAREEEHGECIKNLRQASKEILRLETACRLCWKFAEGEAGAKNLLDKEKLQKIIGVAKNAASPSIIRVELND